VNRKEMGFTVAGALATLAGSACSSAQKADALPDLIAGREPACSKGSLLAITEVVLLAPSSARSPFSVFRAQKATQCTVTSSDPTVCKVEVRADGRIELSAVSVGHAQIMVDDSAAQKEGFYVYVVAAS
jgi:hypothetical protein